MGGSNAQVVTGKPLSAVMAALRIAPDFAYAKPQRSTQLLYVHRQLPDGEVYWVNSRNEAAQTLVASFRVAGKAPQLWHPETGKMEPVSYTIANGLTNVTLPLAPYDAVFVVFRNGTTKTSLTLPVVAEKQLTAVAGPWQVAFQPNRGAPANATFDKLTSYPENSAAGIKYIAGTATYTKTITAPASWSAPKGQLWLDLGEVKNLAEVVVNGKPLGVVWKKPFRVNVTSALKPGANTLKIKVTNLWVNRLVGDAQPAATNKLTYTSMPFYQADAPLLPSGLLAPVRVLQQ